MIDFARIGDRGPRRGQHGELDAGVDRIPRSGRGQTEGRQVSVLDKIADPVMIKNPRIVYIHKYVDPCGVCAYAAYIAVAAPPPRSCAYDNGSTYRRT